MDKAKTFLTILGIGIMLGLLIAIIFIFGLGARPTKVVVSGVEFEIPTLEATVAAEVVQERPTVAPNSLIECSGNDWEKCWIVNDTNKSLTWAGIQNGSADIGQSNQTLEKLKAGYTALFTIEEIMRINICTGQINGQFVSGTCPVIIELQPGTYQVSSPGASGGFRVTQSGMR